MSNSSLKRPGWHVLTRDRSFPATHTFIHKWKKPRVSHSSATKHYRILLISRPANGRRPSWPGWLDSDWSCSCWWHICAAGTNSSRPGGLHWCRCHHKRSRHGNRQSVFCCTPSNTQRAAFSDTYHLANTSARTCGHKGGLLQLSSFGHLRTTVTTAAVCLQRLHSSRVFGEEVRRHNSTPPWTTSRKSEDITPLLRELHWLQVLERIQFLVMCSCVSLPQWHGTVIPRQNPPYDCRPRFTSASSACFHIDAGHTVHTTHHAGRSCVPGDCCSSVECPSAVCSFCVITAAVPLRHEDGTAPVVILFALVFSCVTDCDCNFNIVRCPCNGLCLVKCHLNRHIWVTLHYIASVFSQHGSSSKHCCIVF